MITDRIGQHEVLFPINHNYNKICDILGFFKIKTQEIPSFFASSRRVLSNYLGMKRTVLSHCPISADIKGQLNGTVDSQTDLTILL